MRKLVGILSLITIVSISVLCISFDIYWGMPEEEVKSNEKGVLKKESYSYMAYFEDHSIQEEIKLVSFTEDMGFMQTERVYSFWNNKLFSLKLIFDCTDLGSYCDLDSNKAEFHTLVFNLGELYLSLISHLPEIPGYPPIEPQPVITHSCMLSFQIACLQSFILEIPFTMKIKDVQRSLSITNKLKSRYDSKTSN